MKIGFDERLIALAKKLNKPLYAVGGVVRNFLIDQSIAKDIDLAGDISVEELSCVLDKLGAYVLAEYKRTGTIVFKIGEQKYEYTAFRKEVYESGGGHVPIETIRTSDIKEDALRRDFKCNAVYYDLITDQIVDPLGGVEDIKNKILDTVKDADKVFESDGLRLLRLARFAGELGFRPSENVIVAMKKYAKNIDDISPERIFDELKKILVADTKYAFSDKKGHYVGLKILDDTKVLDRIFPELTLGREMSQRADFHKYDVLEHSLRSVLYADETVRLATLLHDIGKPFCLLRDGYYYHHFEEGEKIAERVLKRLKVDTDTLKRVKFLVKEHMVDLDCSMKENKVRRFIVKNKDMLDSLLLVKQADFRASLEKDELAPTLIKWSRIIDKMQKDGTPFTLKELKITPAQLIRIGYREKNIGKELKKLWDYAIVNPQDNKEDVLLSLANKHLKKSI